ncbi:type-1B angiotensin II receptor [Biomphalaria glabrata]|nr:type-1B angiotensin II receptor [Biomphalaria glabrata]
MSGKDLQVVQQVLLISVIYIISNTPIIIINFAGMYNKEFALQRTYHNLFLSTIGVKHLFQTINSSFNIFIYFKYNTKFRHTLLQVRGLPAFWSACTVTPTIHTHTTFKWKHWTYTDRNYRVLSPMYLLMERLTLHRQKPQSS